ncbi:MAG TPA: pitrilysin family protein [Thermoanaerobaculia bacterium]|nr:pitrilysin family protein [Thermoanaerobaculia bacterium]
MDRLSNGLTVVVSPQRGIPLVTVDVTYDVGSRVELPGRTGFAHLFEHLMFEGSENVGKGEHFRLVAEAGGSMNGTTSEDRTNYFETLPAECLDLGLFLEADRMRALSLTQDKLDNQREAVKEEKRLRVDNQPYAPSFESADALAYDAFAYKHPVIGSMDDLSDASLADARRFYDAYYAPGNALLAITGDVEPAEAFRRARAFFDAVPPRGTPPPFAVIEPPPAGERRAEVADAHAAVPALHLNYKIPDRRHPDLFALSYAEKVLGAGESGRLWRRLVKDDELALSLSITLDERRGPSLFRFFAIARPGVAPERLEAEILADVARLAAEAPTPREMDRVRRVIEAGAVRATQTTQAVAFLLSEYGLYDGDPGLWRRDLDEVLSVEADHVRDAVERWLVAARRSIVAVRPAEAE